jgi:hypothetical protein
VWGRRRLLSAAVTHLARLQIRGPAVMSHQGSAATGEHLAARIGSAWAASNNTRALAASSYRGQGSCSSLEAG